MEEALTAAWEKREVPSLCTEVYAYVYFSPF
jgi:hypothetical protein